MLADDVVRLAPDLVAIHARHLGAWSPVQPAPGFTFGSALPAEVLAGLRRPLAAPPALRVPQPLPNDAPFSSALRSPLNDRRFPRSDLRAMSGRRSWQGR